MKLAAFSHPTPLMILLRLGLAVALMWPVALGQIFRSEDYYPLVGLKQSLIAPIPREVLQNAGRFTDIPEVESPAGASSNWLSTVQEHIRKSEYNITWQDRTYLADLAAAYQAPNRAQNLRTYFTPSGVRVIPRTMSKAEQSPDWEWGLSLSGVGYGQDIRQVVSPDLVAGGDRVEYRRGDVTEWYVNDERGLEQGFTISQLSDSGLAGSLDGLRGNGMANEGELVVVMAVTGNLIPDLNDDEEAIEFATVGGVEVLRYGELKAYDAVGREMPSRFELRGSGKGEDREIRIAVEASEAVYPVTIDPITTAPAWMAESDQANAHVGYSVGTAGDVNGDGYSDVVVGAPDFDNGETDEGRAYAFYGSATGLSTAAAWTAEANSSGANFGYSVGTAGDVNGDGYSDVIVGAPGYSNGQTNEGRAFVYLGSANGLGISATWTAESDYLGAKFGYSVGTAGDVNGDTYGDVIVGAPDYSSGQWEEGRAYVYLGSASGLAGTAAWTAESDQDGANFGYSVGTAGSVNWDTYSDVIVGAPGYSNGQAGEGRAFVYLGSADGLGISATWTAESDQATAYFGSSVGTAGDVNGDGYSDAIVGSRYYDNGQTNEGRAYVYLGSVNGLANTAAWTAENDQLSAYFGWSVGTAGDVNGDGFGDVIVGARFFDSESDGGRAYVYLGSIYGLAGSAIWTAESDQGGAYFGNSVGTAGDVNGDGYSDVIVGAPNHDNGQTDEGIAYVYLGSASGLASAAAWTKESNQADAYFGWSVGTAGDVNDDGYSDVIIGAPNYDYAATDEGRVYIYHGSATGLKSIPAWEKGSGQGGSYFGYSVGTAGDVNGDGFSDVIIGARLYHYTHVDAGRVYVYHGSPIGLASNPAWTADASQSYAFFGNSVGTAGDVNGDGYSDVIVGAPSYDNGQTNEGRAYVYLGSASGLAATAAWTTESDQADAWFGYSVGTAGDVNGDGYSDVIVGAMWYDNGQTDEGRAYVYLGSPLGLASNPAWTAESDQADARFGYSVGTAGDVNGDGYSDVIVGAIRYDNGQTDEGRAYVYLGSANGLASVADWTAESDQATAYFGSSVGTAGDVNGDGYSDVIIGAFCYDNGQTDEGRAYVYLGSANGLASVAAWTGESDQAIAYFGYSVGTAGDVNGDGYSDVIVGASYYDNEQTDEGKVFVFYGGGGAGLALRPRQLQSDFSTPIAPLGYSDSATSVSISVIARMPLGREKVKLEWQAAPLGTSFDSPSTITGTSSIWHDTFGNGLPVGEIVSGLTPHKNYRWRVRLIYRPGNRMGQHAGRWLNGNNNAWSEVDFRTPGNLVFLPIVVKSYAGGW